MRCGRCNIPSRLQRRRPTIRRVLRSGLIVEVPEAEPMVGDWRARLDPLAGRGVPAHVTVLFPFIPVPEIDDRVTRRLHDLFTSVQTFEFNLIDVRWFDQSVVWLAPDTDAEFRRLTTAVYQAYPEYPPYEGQFDDAVPHLTIGDRAPIHHMQDAARQLQPALPVRATARAVTLMTEAPGGHWARSAQFPFTKRT